MNNFWKTVLFAFVGILVFNTTTTIARHSRSIIAGEQYPYKTAPNDPTKTRIYTLKNGLTVYISVNKAEPRVNTSIAVRAGSKHDPSDATGLAHYLEHMLFKGTDKFGTLDYPKEAAELQKIEDLYEIYRNTNNAEVRKKIYHRIDSISGYAATLAIANEYDKMLGSIGAKGTNAYTWFEQTVYVNDVPSNQLEKWLNIEAERFRSPVYRIFHTELEAVYEEKNIGLDNDQRLVWESVAEALFQNHHYGTQTTIGTVDHLKNPSLKAIREYYNRYYVPNNMAICLAGDLDPDQAIRWIDQKFGYMQPKKVQPYTFEPEPEQSNPVIKEIFGPDAESVTVGFRLPGVTSAQAKYIQMMSRVLYNQVAGLIDLNLNQQQKLLNAFSSTWDLQDYSLHLLVGRSKKGQSLEDVRDLLLQQIEQVKLGKFDESLLKSVGNNLKIEAIREREQNAGRVNSMVDAFVTGQDWNAYTRFIDDIAKVTKKELVQFAQTYYRNNYAVIFKRTGERKNIQKVEKPPITPVATNRDAQSPFVKEILESKAGTMQPRFLDFSRDIQELRLKNGVPVLYLKNDENELFRMYYLLDMGRQHDKIMALAVQYLQFLGTTSLSAEDLKKKFFGLGCKFTVFVAQDQLYVVLEGLQKNFTEATALLESLLANPKADEKALAELVERTLKSRADAKKNKGIILRQAMMNYGMFGAMNPQRDILSESELRALKPDVLLKKIQEITSYQHRVLYYGPAKTKDLTTALDKQHRTPANLKPVLQSEPYQYQDTKENTVLFVDYDMVQAEIMLLTKSGAYQRELTPQVNLFNEYFGGNMSSLVFQTIRESKALAYSVFSLYRQPQKRTEPYYIQSYVGTQADKFHEAISGMTELLNQMPRADKNFEQAKNALKNNIETERIIRENILFNYEQAKKLGIKEDIRKVVYEKAPTMNFDILQQFYAQHIKDKPYTMLVLGSKKKLSIDDLSKYGKVKELTLEEIFGY